MQKVFVSYKLRPGVTIEQYEAWSREVDQRITPGQNGIIRFEVYRIEGADKGEPFCQIVEDIEVESYEIFAETVKSRGMEYIIETFGKLADESTVNMVYGSKIVPALLPEGSRPPIPVG
jgi:hypothetical protein